MAIETASTGIPAHEDGSPYAIAATAPDGTTIFADTYDEILAELIPSYPTDLSSEDEVERADALRFAYLAQEADALQERFAVAAAEGGFLSEDADDTVKYLVAAPRTEHIEVPGGRWDVKELPLVLLTTNYAPLAPEHPAPEGEAIIWLDPSTSRTYVQSLFAAAGLQVLEHPEGEGDGEDEPAAP